MVSKEQLVQITKSSIDNLITVYALTPHLFYAEHDLHAFLYRDILNRLPMKDWHCKTIDGKLSLLLHEEYPAKERYSEKQLKENVPKGKRGHFDVCIWNPEKTSSRRFRVTQSTKFDEEQQTYIAIEFDLVEHSDSLEQAVHHLKWDLMKLKSTKNEVEYRLFTRICEALDPYGRISKAGRSRDKKREESYSVVCRENKRSKGNNRNFV